MEAQRRCRSTRPARADTRDRDRLEQRRLIREGPASYAADGPTGKAAVLASGGYLTSAATSMGFVANATFAAEGKAEPSASYRRIWDWKSSSGGDGDGLLLDLTPSNSL